MGATMWSVNGLHSPLRTPVMSCDTIAQTAPQWWSTVEPQDERRHQWLLDNEAKATRRIEERLRCQNFRVLTGDFVISRLGEVAHQKAAIADCLETTAIQQCTEVQA